MPQNVMKLPGSDHPITIEPHLGRVVVRAAGQTIADSRNALSLREASSPPVFYIPRADVDMALLERTAHTSHCAYKGQSAYYSIPAGGARLVNAIWSYETPYDAVSQIRDYLAFYPDRVEIVATSA